MLPSVLAVRDKCLSAHGIIIPCKARILIAAALLPSLDKLMIHGHEEDAIKLDAKI